MRPRRGFCSPRGYEEPRPAHVSLSPAPNQCDQLPLQAYWRQPLPLLLPSPCGHRASRSVWQRPAARCCQSPQRARTQTQLPGAEKSRAPPQRIQQQPATPKRPRRPTPAFTPPSRRAEVFSLRGVDVLTPRLRNGRRVFTQGPQLPPLLKYKRSRAAESG